MNTTNISGLLVSCMDTLEQMAFMLSSSFMCEAFSQADYSVSSLSSHCWSVSRRPHRRFWR
jgi:hypothetical protein